MSPSYLAVSVPCLVPGAMLGSTMDTCSASPGWLLEVFYDFLRDWADSAPEVDSPALTGYVSVARLLSLENLYIVSTSLLCFQLDLRSNFCAFRCAARLGCRIVTFAFAVLAAAGTVGSSS